MQQRPEGGEGLEWVTCWGEECSKWREREVQSPEASGCSAGWRNCKEASLAGGRVCNNHRVGVGGQIREGLKTLAFPLSETGNHTTVLSRGVIGSDLYMRNIILAAELKVGCWRASAEKDQLGECWQNLD